MSLETKIMEDLKEAMKAKDQAAMRGIRQLNQLSCYLKPMAAVMNWMDQWNQIVAKLVKQRQDSHDIYKQQNRKIWRK